MREAAGLTAAQAAKTLDSAQGKISRIELGQSGVTMGDLMLLLDLYQVEAVERQRLLDLSRDNRRRGRWTGHRSKFPEWFRAFVDLERDASDMRLVETEVVPGLFQTEAYMRILYSANSPFAEPVDIDSAVASRLERQELLDSADSPLVSCVLSESGVRRMVGDRTVMAEQLRHLADLAERPRVQLQLYPFEAEVVGGCIGQRFTLIRIPAARASEPFTFAYCEDLDDARYIDDERSVRVYEAAWGAMQAAALGPGDTRRRLLELARSLT